MVWTMRNNSGTEEHVTYVTARRDGAW